MHEKAGGKKLVRLPYITQTASTRQNASPKFYHITAYDDIWHGEQC